MTEMGGWCGRGLATKRRKLNDAIRMPSLISFHPRNKNTITQHAATKQQQNKPKKKKKKIESKNQNKEEYMIHIRPVAAAVRLFLLSFVLCVRPHMPGQLI